MKTGQGKIAVKKMILTGLTGLCALAVCAAREVVPFNEGWRFARFGPMPDGTERAEPEGLENSAADDAGWRRLNLPHDWGIEGPFRAELPNSTGKLPWAGIGWYRKHFEIAEADRGQRVFIDFDGAMSRAKIWLNGNYIGEWPYGYSSFRMELTDHLNFGGENVLAVRLDNPQESSRWYPGGGIYRNVWLVKTAPVHVSHWGTSVTTPEVSADRAAVRIETRVMNQSGDAAEILLRHEIYEKTNPEAPTARLVLKKTIEAGAESSFDGSVTLSDPKLWDVTAPNLYEVRTAVIQENRTVDSYQTTFGIRTIQFSADEGFRLNGRSLKIQGVCLHHDLGPLGTAVNTRAIERQLEIMKEMGCNAVRTSHNPPAPELLELCDRMGLMVQVEAFDCWAAGKTPNDYSTLFDEWHERDMTAMVHRDRNHPSVIMWSSGNEIMEQWPRAFNPGLSRGLTALLHRLDPARPVSVSCNNADSGFNEFAHTMDLFGYNYKPHLYAEFREKNPGVPLYGGETSSCISSRGEYFFPVSEDHTKGCGGYFQVSSYDLYGPKWGYCPDVEFAAQDRNHDVFGEFVWTGFDYIGEPTPYNKDKTNLLNFQSPEARKKAEEELDCLGGNTPSRSSYFGIVDLCGFKKDRFYLYQSRWRPELPMAHILPHWNWPERVGLITPVHVYTSGDEAELFLNGQSLGRKKKGPYEYRLRWDDVVYQPGELKVVACKDGNVWAESRMKTTGPPVKIGLSADRRRIAADGADLSFVTVNIADAAGQTVPRTHHSVRFKLDGPGEIIAVGNGDPTSHESFQASERKAFNGLCLAVIRSKRDSSGIITLTAEAEGLRSADIRISSD